MKKLLAAAAIVATTAPTGMMAPASAHDGATGIVEERMHAMKKMGKAVRSLKGMMKDEAPYDADTVRAQAKTIQLHAGKTMTEQFPEGSLQEPTHARAEIWSDWDRFSRLATRLETLASGLELAAGNGLTMEGKIGDGMNADAPDANALGQMPAVDVYRMLVQTCSSCHREFRARKP